MADTVANAAERRLTTILAADVAEYSRLMRADEDATLAALTAARAIVDALIAQHRGRIANTAGDAVLAEFPSVADALSCALAVQQAIATQNETVPPDRRMLFRIGVHVGDVLAKDGDLFGDAVNIAARMEALAEPGGICVSAAAREHAGTRLTAVFTDIGAQQVKNIAEPVHVFRVAPRASRPESPLPNPPPLAGEGRVGATDLPIAAGPLPLPDKPSIAVLPFTNMSSDPEQEFFADGIAEDIITALSRFPSLFVIARNSCFTYKGRAVDVKQVGRELGVRYVLEGSLRKSGNRIRVTAQLVEAGTGNHLWAERYDRDLADIFAVQDEITQAVTTAIAPAVAGAEQQRAMRKPPENLDAWAAYQRGLWHLEKASPEDCQRAAQLFQQAIDLDPSFAGGYVGLATARVSASLTSQTLSIAEAQRSAEALARRAVALDPASAEGGACLSASLRWRGDLEGARAEAERALTLSPNLALAHGESGAALIFSGQPKEGIEAAETALRLDPRNPMRAFDLLLIVIGQYFCRDYQATVEAARHAIRAYPDFAFSYRWLAAALGQLGRAEEAKEALEKAVASAPATFDKYVRNRVPWHRPEDHAHMLDGLRKAGWDG
jgi:adenylate cyclase